MSLSILHIAPQNFAGVPYEIVEAERKRGIDSWLITMWPHPYGFGEDECLDLPFAANDLTRLFQRLFKTTPKTRNIRRIGLSELPPKWNGHKFPANMLFNLRDALWRPKYRKAGFPQRLDKFDIVVLDGGLPLLRSGKWILEWAHRGGRLVTTYYGTDLRQHGVIPAIDEAAKAVFVMEFDHTLIHPEAVWLPFPFDPSGLPKANPPGGPIRIGHVATNRSAKGTDSIIAAIDKLARKIKIEPVIIERMPHDKTIELKSTCHIFIDQLGELGYGISGLESLAMGIPTVVQLLPDHEKFLGKHPFVVADSKSLSDVLEKLAGDPELRREKGDFGRRWVREFHDPNRAIDIILNKYSKLGWLPHGEFE